MILWSEEDGGYRARLRPLEEALGTGFVAAVCCAVSILVALRDFPIFLLVAARLGAWALRHAALRYRSSEWIFVTLDGKASWSGDSNEARPMEPAVVSRFVLEHRRTRNYTILGYEVRVVLVEGQPSLSCGQFYSARPNKLVRLIRQLNELVGVDPAETTMQLARRVVGQPKGALTIYSLIVAAALAVYVGAWIHRLRALSIL